MPEQARELIALAGLTPVEKRQLALDLAAHHEAVGRSCAILDSGQRLPVADQTSEFVVRALPDPADLSATANALDADCILWISSEQLSPDGLLLALDELSSDPGWKVRSVALIDTRTCDCFPQVRHALEAAADTVIMLPCTLDEVLEAML